MFVEIITVGDELLIGQVLIRILPGWGKPSIMLDLK